MKRRTDGLAVSGMSWASGPTPWPFWGVRR